MANIIEASIEPAIVSLLAGETAEITASVRNLGQTVDQFTIDVDGLDTNWYTIPVSSVALFPNDQDNMRILLHPPKAAEDKPGHYSFHITVVSQENPDEIASTDVSIEIKALLELELQISPERAVGRMAVYQVLVINPRDSQAVVRLEAVDDRQRLCYRFDTSILTVPGGGQADTALEVKPSRLAFFGGEKPFVFRGGVVLREEADHATSQFCMYCGHKFHPSYDEIPIIGPWYGNKIRERYSAAPIFCSCCSRRLRVDAKTAEAEFVRTSWTNSLRGPKFKWLKRIRFPRIRFPSCSRQPVIDTFEVTTKDEREFMISWSVSKAREVKLDNEDVDTTGEIYVRPAETTTYTLTAINRRKSASESIEVHPLPLPRETSAERINASLSPTAIKVQAGTVPAQAMLQIQNLGDIVDKFTVEIEGIDESWYKRSASSVALMPQATDQVQIAFHPPKKEGVRAGEYPFVVSVRSQSAPEDVTIVAGQIEVLPGP